MAPMEHLFMTAMLAEFATQSRAKMLKAWGRRSSFNLLKVMWVIGKLEPAHRHVDAGGSFEPSSSSARASLIERCVIRLLQIQ